MIKFLIFALLANPFQALASNPKIREHSSLEARIYCCVIDNSILAEKNMGGVITTVTKDLATGKFAIASCGLINGDYVYIVPHEMTVEDLKAEIAKHEATTAKK